MTTVAWLHDDCLRHWYGDDPAIYVFDEARLRLEHWSLKRVGFLYECLLEMPVEIRRGDPVSEVLSFQQLHKAAGVRAMKTADPWLQKKMADIHAETVVPEEFAAIPGNVDLRRFSRYWTKAEKALRSNG